MSYSLYGGTGLRRFHLDGACVHKTNYDAEPLPMETVITQIISIVTKDKNALPLASKAFLQCLLANSDILR